MSTKRPTGYHLAALLAFLTMTSACGDGSGADQTMTVPGETATTLTPTTAASGGGSGIAPVAGGFQLEAMETFQLVLVVTEDGADVIDSVLLLCAPEGTMLVPPTTVGSMVLISEGAFEFESPDVAVAGEFTSPTRAEGRIVPLTPEAESCGVPAPSGRWVVICSVEVDTEHGLELQSATSGPCAETGTGTVEESAESTAATEPQGPPALGAVETAAGPLEIESISKTDRYPEGCTEADLGCTTSDSGPRIVVVTMRAAPGLTVNETLDALELDGFASSEALETTIDDGSGSDPLKPFSLQSGFGDTFEIAFAFILSADTTSVTFTWPGNDPLVLDF